MKNKALALAIYMACATPTVSIAKSFTKSISGLNLGEVKSRSSLGEPFKGYIPILFTSKKQAKKLKVKLAPKHIFTQAGAEKSAELSNLEFRVNTRRGKPVIVVSSSHAVNLPILNFILEIKSPSGIIYQDYTIMLNPLKTDTRKTKHRKKAPKTYFSPQTLKKYTSKYRVLSGDTLSAIAKRHKRKGISLKRMIKSIYSANPSAFSHNNINHLKKGVVLHIPSAREIKNFNRVASKAKPKYSAKKQKNAKHKTIRLSSYKVKKGDSLSKITRKFVYKGTSFTRMMRAIHKSNPHAFSRNNINQLKVNVRLRIPTYTEIAHKKKQANIVATSHEKNTTKFNAKENKKADSSNNLKAAETITNLQKRIRELRNELSSITTVNENLQKAITNIQSQKTINRPIESTTSTQETANEILNINKQLLESKNRDSHSLSRNENEPLVALNDEAILDSISNFNSAAPVTTMTTSDISTDLLNTNNLSYAMLALLLGMGFLQLRKRKSYSTISYEHPKFYPSHDAIKIDQNQTEENTLSTETTETTETCTIEYKTNTIQKESIEPSPKIFTAIQSHSTPEKDLMLSPSSVITKKELQECNLLIDELILDLSNKTNLKTRKNNFNYQQIENILATGSQHKVNI